MIFEKSTLLRFDIYKLKKHLEKNVFSISPTYQSPAFGGWSVLSSDGTVSDGWTKGHLGLSEKMSLEDYQNLKEYRKPKPLEEYVVPTEINTGYLKEVMSQITSLNLEPKRARIIQLSAGTSSSWHADSPSRLCAVRLHIPIITNDQCFFETETSRAHLPADGSMYFLFVNRTHRVVNNGSSNRYHLVMDVRDIDGITKHHKWWPPKNV